MWYFASPLIVFGESSLGYLNQIKGERAFIVSDRNVSSAGLTQMVKDECPAELQMVGEFLDVEPDPTLSTAERGAVQMLQSNPDWIIAVGGGSVMDAAKAMWILYERPDISVDAINPIETLGLRKKARLIAIPTTVGTGSEATWATVLTDPKENRKLGLGNRECLPDVAILDPAMVKSLPLHILIDTAMDALTHAVEGYTSTWNNVFSDGLCLKAIELICTNLPRILRQPNDDESRAELQNAAAIAGLGFGNSMAGLAHGLGHALGGVFHTAHGKAVSLFLPYSIGYSLGGSQDSTRYRSIASMLGLPSTSEREAGDCLSGLLRDTMLAAGQPRTIAELGIEIHTFEEHLEALIDNAMYDTQTLMGTRIPDRNDLERLFRAAYFGNEVTF